MGTAVYGLAFGALAAQIGMALRDAALMSAVVFSGSAQLAAIGALGQGASITAICAVVLAMNARYLLYGAALRPWMGSLPWWQTYPSLFFLGDANWALSVRRHEAGQADGGFVLGSGLATFIPWVAGSVAGFVGGTLIQDPARLGLDFLLAAFAVTLLVGGWRSDTRVAPLIMAAIAAMIVHHSGLQGAAVLADGLVGAATATLQAVLGKREL